MRKKRKRGQATFSFFEKVACRLFRFLKKVPVPFFYLFRFLKKVPVPFFVFLSPFFDQPSYFCVNM